MAIRGDYRCVALKAGGAVCGRTFSRKWNLQRHMRTQHQVNIPVFTFMLESPVEDVHPAETVLTNGEASPRYHQATGNLVPLYRPNQAYYPGDPTPRMPLAAPVSDLPLAWTLPPIRTPLDPDTVRAPKRRWLSRDKYEEIMPNYNVKRSQDIEQQKGIQWLTQAGRDAFNERHTGLMNTWGLQPAHTGTCVIIPAEWAYLDPEYLLNCPFTSEVSPRVLVSGRLGFKYDDHITSYGRSAAWFQSWPRTGIELDNFIETGPFQRKDGSHLCHNSLCINKHHLTYEWSYTNYDRHHCHDHAKSQRRRGETVPARCFRHAPPCLLQHSVLTTYERCLIQLNVLRVARGFPIPSAPSRPPRHPYPTVEHVLPLHLQPPETSSVCLNENNIYHGPVTSQGRLPRPNLVCTLCSRRIIAFATVTGLWTHIVHKHGDSEPSVKLAEVRRAGRLWREFQRTSRTGTGRGFDGKTAQRLRQLDDDAVCWFDILEWNLR